MAGSFKMFGVVRVPPDGRPVTLCAPQGGRSAVVGKLIIMSRWPQREQEGYKTHHVDNHGEYAGYGYGNIQLARHIKEGNQWFRGYPQGVEITDNRGYRKKGLLTTFKSPPTGPGGRQLLHNLTEVHNTAAWAGAYSLFKLTAGGGTVTPLIAAPRCDRILEMNQAIPLGPGQTLQAVNGLTDFSSPYYENNFHPSESDGRHQYDSMVRDHQTRACTLQVAVFGQEFPA